jgi:N-acetylmuramoyl-L-alanine amidase
MSLFSRVTAFAVASLALIALGQGTPGLAAELDRTAIAATTPALPGIAAGQTDPVLVPAIATDTDVAQPAATDKFASLADAVAAQDSDAADDNLRCLASAIYFESKGEPVAGQLAVAEVIINRSRSGRFASDLCGVVKQRGQFSFVRGGTIPAIDADRPAYRTALAVAKVALTEAWNSAAAGALFFHARRVAPAARFTRVAAIGNHVFYR